MNTNMPLDRFLRAPVGLLVAGMGILIMSLPIPAAQDGAVLPRLLPEQVRWVDEPNGMGFQRATIEGDPSQPGLYVVRVKFPPWVMSNNHFHREDRYAVVLQGTWYTGEGDEFAPERTVPLGPGSVMKHPAGTHHFDGAREQEVIVQIVGIGPSSTTRLRPQEGNYISFRPR